MANTNLETFSVPRTAESDTAALATRLRGVQGFKLNQSSPDYAVCHVGNLFIYKMIGVLVTSNYTPPLQVKITRRESEYSITVSSRSQDPLGSLDKNTQFFADGARKVRQLIEG